MIEIIETNGTIKLVQKDSVDLKWLQEQVGGYIEVLHLEDNKLMIINEEGKLNGLEFNKLATVRLLHKGGPVLINDYIVGPAIVMNESLLK